MSATDAPARGAYLADERTAQTTPPAPSWIGRVQQVLDEERVLLVTPTGYEWPVPLTALRPATAQEEAAYEAACPPRWRRRTRR